MVPSSIATSANSSRSLCVKFCEIMNTIVKMMRTSYLERRDQDDDIRAGRLVGTDCYIRLSVASN